MKLPNFWEKFLPARTDKREYFLALQIKARQIKAAVWPKEEKGIPFVNFSSSSYSGDWGEAIRAADEAIVEASTQVPQEAISQVIFGIPPPWTAENKILEPHLQNLKKLCTDLSLKPLGFIVLPEALLNYLKQIEGVPPTALLLGIEEESLTLTLLKAGKIEGMKVLEKEGGKTFPEQIEKALAEFRVEVLPSRLLLYDGQDLEKIKSDLLSYRWTDKLPFLHLPKIETLDKDFDIKALAFASSRQMGGVISFEETSVLEGPEAVQSTEVPSVPSAETLGFVKGKDILEENQEPFLVSQTPPQEEKPAGVPRKAFKLPPFPHFKLPPFPRFNFDFSFLEGKLKWLVLLILFFSFLAIAAFAAYQYLPQAEITVWVESQPLGKEVQITVAENSAEGEGTERITGKIVESEESASQKVAATGKKTVGDPAKGKIVIYNKTENEKKFSQGTVLVSPDGLRFTLDGEVKMASTPAFSTSFSQVSANVTAVKIGPEGNLSSGTNFSFKDYPTSSYFAKIEENFSGGTSREVAVVTKNDQKKLSESLTLELTEKGKENLATKLNPEEKLIEGTLKTTVKEEKFDKKIDEEAAELNLDLVMLFQALAYNEKDLEERLMRNLEEATPVGYELKREETKIEVLGIETGEKEATLRIAAKTTLLPKINLEEIKKNIVGKKKPLAEDYLKGRGGVTQVETTISFPFPFPFSLPTLPRSSENIEITVISQ